MTLTGFFDKRTRYKRPTSLTIAGIAFLIMPFMNYYYMTLAIKRPLGDVALNLIHVGPLYTGLMAVSLVVGVGLLSVQKWGWWAAMVYSGTLIVYNTYIITVSPVDVNFGAIARTAVGTLLLIYFGSRDISAPYFKVYPRGWRLQKRSPVRIDLAVNGQTLTTSDLSARGFYVEWAGCELNPNDTVNVTIQTAEEELNLEAGVVRVDQEGAGIAFRGVDRALRRKLNQLRSAVA